MKKKILYICLALNANLICMYTIKNINNQDLEKYNLNAILEAKKISKNIELIVQQKIKHCSTWYSLQDVTILDVMVQKLKDIQEEQSKLLKSLINILRSPLFQQEKATFIALKKQGLIKN